MSPFYCKRCFSLLGSRSKIILYIYMSIKPCKEASKCMLAEEALKQKVEVWPLELKFGCSSQTIVLLEEIPHYGVPVSVGWQKACNLQTCTWRNCKNSKNMSKTFCPKLPIYQKVLKSSRVSKSVNTSWIFLSPLSISWETLHMARTTKMFGQCIMARNTYVYHAHLSTYPTTNIAEVPLALKDNCPLTQTSSWQKKKKNFLNKTTMQVKNNILAKVAQTRQLCWETPCALDSNSNSPTSPVSLSYQLTPQMAQTNTCVVSNQLPMTNNLVSEAMW